MEKKKTVKKNVTARRLPASTEGTRKRFIFEAFCLALAQENWGGALMLLKLHEKKGKIDEFKPFLREHIKVGE